MREPRAGRPKADTCRLRWAKRNRSPLDTPGLLVVRCEHSRSVDRGDRLRGRCESARPAASASPVRTSTANALTRPRQTAAQDDSESSPSRWSVPACVEAFGPTKRVGISYVPAGRGTESGRARSTIQVRLLPIFWSRAPPNVYDTEKLDVSTQCCGGRREHAAATDRRHGYRCGVYPDGIRTRCAGGSVHHLLRACPRRFVSSPTTSPTQCLGVRLVRSDLGSALVGLPHLDAHRLPALLQN